MERQFLKILLLSILVSCQQVELNQNNSSELISKDEALVVSDLETIQTPPYQNIWDYIKQNNRV